MVKRSRGGDESRDEASTKRSRPSSVDALSKLSDELLLKILSLLPVSRLVVCQRLSHKYHSLAGDGQLWKVLYYNRFVRPRASRLPSRKEALALNDSSHYSSKRSSRWLEDDHLVKSGGRTNWKKQYKLRHNWSRGSCAVNEIPVAEQAPIPPILVQMYGGIVYMVNQSDGLRAWSTKDRQRLVAQRQLSAVTSRNPPTSLAIDTQAQSNNRTRVVVGFENGSFSIYMLHQAAGSFTHHYSHEASSNGVISATALTWPYALTMTATQLLSLYRFPDPPADEVTEGLLDSPRLLHALRSRTVWPPLSVSLRTSVQAITICVAYTLPTYLSGWTVGLQEVKVDPDGFLLGSRLASAIDQHYRPLAFSSRPIMQHLAPLSPAAGSSASLELKHIHSKPTSLSYTHPYLLVSHPDNTLTLYLVTSTAESLAISAGSRLWGHTSSVSGAHVGGRGKAVSVSRRGDELRVWELEGGFGTSTARKRLATGDLSVQIRPERVGNGSRTTSTLDSRIIGQAISTRSLAQSCGLEHAADEDICDLTLTRGWIGFDEEKVVLLKERSQGTQALVVYDFT
ncbi:hypothetical protein DOTSEDRAFT_69920 [Dothistroma septosporum NZE10]|uniref:F-box domain-containing protein n=1 Tax=Dothistroma septosporum (strain NZE10 / CBS 128990) TaxID=675120 RepID=N1Q113_DOTSN|nr:hypothetical protein DOTSEDRAFT_69920 [Dothistroma septosporum NZE10]